MKDNPYSKILGMMKAKNEKYKDNIIIGKVVSASPFIVQVGDLQIDRDNILIADYLLEGYSRDYTTDRLIPGGSSSGNIKYADSVTEGDKLAILRTGDNQIYIIIARLKEV